MLDGDYTSSPGVAHRTRSRVRNLQADRSRTLSVSVERTTRVDESRTRLLISESISDMSGEITSSITNEVSRLVQGMNLNGNAPASRNVINPAIWVGSDENSASNNNSPEKIMNTIRNWKLSFSGYKTDIPFEEFIYRVNIMTTNTLGGNFELLSLYIHILFEDKALEWY